MTPRAIYSWFFNAYFQIGLGAFSVTASELLMKAGANHTTGPMSWLGVAALASGWTWLGIICYVLSFVSWIHVLRTVPLGIAYAMINVVHVLIPLGSWAFLHESISSLRWCGIGLVVGGLLLIIGPVAQAEAKL
jgi:multidrug transporter EmrE-like cation transporter